jgi:hypothetical protein
LQGKFVEHFLKEMKKIGYENKYHDSMSMLARVPVGFGNGLTLVDTKEVKEGSKVLVSFNSKYWTKEDRSGVQFEIKWLRLFEEDGAGVDESAVGADNGPRL